MAVRTVGFVGLRIMGAPMAANLVEAASTSGPPHRDGRSGAASAPDAARDRDVVIFDMGTARPATAVALAAAGRARGVGVLDAQVSGGKRGAIDGTLVFLEAHEVDPIVAVGALCGGLAGSAVLDRRAPSMVKGDFTRASGAAAAGGGADRASGVAAFGGDLRHPLLDRAPVRAWKEVLDV